MSTDNEKSPFFTTITSSIMILYFMGLSCAVPYFNYKYANENGFVSWLFLGEFVPTLKATIWPYYLYQQITIKKNVSEPNKTVAGSTVHDLEKQSLDCYEKGMQLHQEWSKYMYNKENLPLDEAWRRADNSFDKSVYYLNQVDPIYLSKIHPDLPMIFKTKFLKLIEMERIIFYNRESFKLRKDREQYFKNYIILATNYMDWMNANSKNFKNF